MDGLLATDNIGAIRQSLVLAESLARASLMTSPAAKRRLVARSIELQIGYVDEESGDFVPPKQLLLYLVRSGNASFVLFSEYQ